MSLPFLFAPSASTAGRLRPPLRLQTRVGLVLTGLAATMLLVLGMLWLHATRAAIHEEVEAATRVSEQWLGAIAGELRTLPVATREGRLLEIVRAVGRVRANALEILGEDGSQRYVSPPSTYKAGRVAPSWFAALLDAELPSRRLDVAGHVLILTPDNSRAVLDAWDDLKAMAGWAGLLLGLMFIATRQALARALRPLDQVMLALDRTGSGAFDTRLPPFETQELARLSRAFNGMADRLKDAVNDNVRLETEREVAARMQSRLEFERQAISRELHDELAQGITAVRALAGAMAQRTVAQPELQRQAHSIVAVTGQMQDGVRNILHRLRTMAARQALKPMVERCCATWQQQHPEIVLNLHCQPGSGCFPEQINNAVLRMVQEGLTNVLRHSEADRVDLAVEGDGEVLQILIADNGRGRRIGLPPQDGSGLGLSGMRERMAALGGQLQVGRPDGGGFRLLATLPVMTPASEEKAT